MTIQALKNISLRISSGGTPSRRHSEYFSKESGHLWVKSKELLDSGISSTEEKITDDALNNSSAKYFPEHSVLIAMYGANVGQLGWLRNPATVNQAVCGLVIDPEKADWRYVFYALLQNRDNLTVQARGAAQQNLNQDLIKSFEIPFLSLDDQHLVSDVLSAYDDLIENNTRRIQILEQLAQAIYIEWFVKFRFPGYEKVKMVDSGTDFGKIPEGWEVKKIGEIFSVKYGKNLPKTTITESGKFPVYGAGGVIGFYSEKNINDKTALITSRGNGSGTVWRTKGSGFVTNNSFSITGKDWYSYFNMSLIYNLLLSANIRSSISGSAQPQVTINSLNYVEVLVPEKSIAEIFQNEAMYLYDLSDRLFMTNQNLRQTRDLLLPRLVTGEIKV